MLPLSTPLVLLMWCTAGLHPFPFHVLCVAMHAVASMLVLALCQHLVAVLEECCSGNTSSAAATTTTSGTSSTPSSGQQQQLSTSQGKDPKWQHQPELWRLPISPRYQAQALLAGLMFALHPIHTEVRWGSWHLEPPGTLREWMQVAMLLPWRSCVGCLWRVQHDVGSSSTSARCMTHSHPVACMFHLCCLHRRLQASWGVLSSSVRCCPVQHCYATSWLWMAGMQQQHNNSCCCHLSTHRQLVPAHASRIRRQHPHHHQRVLWLLTRCSTGCWCWLLQCWRCVPPSARRLASQSLAPCCCTTCSWHHTCGIQVP